MSLLFSLSLSLLGIAILTRLILIFLRPITKVNALPHPLTKKFEFIDPQTGKLHTFPIIFDENNSKIFSATKSLSLIVPCYNEQLRLPKMLDATLDYFIKKQNQEPGFSFEIILVDDGSSDKTVQICLCYVEKYGADTIRLLKLPKNMGKGAAVRNGTLRSRGQFILMVDADGATKIDDYRLLENEMFKLAPQGEAAVVVGSRHHLAKAAAAKRAFHRNLLMHGFRLMVRLLAHVNINDTQCGFKLFTRRAAQLLFFNQHLERWCFDVELLFIAHQLRIPINEIAVNWTEVEGSKLKLIESSILMARDLFVIRFAYATKIWRVEIPSKEQIQNLIDMQHKRIR